MAEPHDQIQIDSSNIIHLVTGACPKCDPRRKPVPTCSYCHGTGSVQIAVPLNTYLDQLMVSISKTMQAANLMITSMRKMMEGSDD